MNDILWVQNLTKRDVSVDDLAFTIKSGKSVNVFKMSPFITRDQVQRSLDSGSLYRRIKCNILRITNEEVNTMPEKKENKIVNTNIKYKQQMDDFIRELINDSQSIENRKATNIEVYDDKEIKNLEKDNQTKNKPLIYFPKVSIITLTRNNIDILKKCCFALISNTYYPNWEWIIGDSNSNDGTREYINSLNDLRITLIERNTIEGSFSSINNELVKHASGELLLFLNDDTEPQQFWLFEMVFKLQKNIDVGIVGAKLEYRKNVIQHAGIAFIPNGPVNIGHNILSSFHPKFANYDRYLQAVTGACMLIRKKDFEEVGGFDPVYYFCYEDVDLCLKIRKQLNKKVLYAANAILTHSESITQKKYKTSGAEQNEGIRVFKERWMKEIEIDFDKLRKDVNKDIYNLDISFVTCVSNIEQYKNFVICSLLRNNTEKKFDIIPVYNLGNKYSASQALNIGIDKSRSDIIIFCHQDVKFPSVWIDMLFERITEVSKITNEWGVLGTAGINPKDDTIGAVYNSSGGIEWQSTSKHTVRQMQTLDEHCIIIRKSSGLRFDEDNFNGFHFYGIDMALDAINKGLKNFGILCPLVHHSSSSLKTGKEEFMRLLNILADKWKSRFSTIRTPTSIISKGKAQTFLNFRQVK